DHERGPLRVSGRAGAGKTTALVQRYLRLAREVPPSEILVLCRTAGAAVRFRDAVLPELAGGFDALPVTSFRGVAFDLAARASGQVRVLQAGEQLALVRELLAEEGRVEWPTLHSWLARDAFADEVAAGVRGWREVGV